MNNTELIVAIMDRSRAYIVSNSPDDIKSLMMLSDEDMTRELIATLPNDLSLSLLNHLGREIRHKLIATLLSVAKDIEKDIDKGD